MVRAGLGNWMREACLALRLLFINPSAPPLISNRGQLISPTDRSGTFLPVCGLLDVLLPGYMLRM